MWIVVEIFLSARDKHDSPVCMVYTEHRILLNFQLMHTGSQNAFRPIVQEKNCNRLQVIKWTRVIKNIISQFIFRWAFAMVNLKLVRCRSICKGSRPQLQPNQWWLFQNQAFARCTLLISSFGWTYLKPSPCNKLSVAIVKVPDILTLNDCEMHLY